MIRAISLVSNASHSFQLSRAASATRGPENRAGELSERAAASEPAAAEVPGETRSSRSRALAKWLAERRLYYGQRGDQRLSMLRDVKLPPDPAVADDRSTIARSVFRTATRRAEAIRLVDFRERDREKGGHIVIRGSKSEPEPIAS